jgi:hypothetical protein
MSVSPELKGFVVGGTQASLIGYPALFLLLLAKGEPLLATFLIPAWFLCLYMNTEAKKW